MKEAGLLAAVERGRVDSFREQPGLPEARNVWNEFTLDTSNRLGRQGHGEAKGLTHEVLLLEYVTLRADELGEELESQSRLFNRPGACVRCTGRENHT